MTAFTAHPRDGLFLLCDCMAPCAFSRGESAAFLRGRILAFVTLFMLLIAAAGSASAQTPANAADAKTADFPGLDIQAEVGFDGHVDQAAPIPLSFLLSNHSETTIEGELVLTEPSSGKRISLGRVFLGPNSTRRFSSIQALTDWYQCVATLTDGSQVFWRRELALMTGQDFSGDLNHLMLIDDSGRSLTFPNQGSNNSPRFEPGRGLGRAVEPLTVRSWQVPQHPGPLTVAEGLVFSEDAKANMLNEAQYDAVGKWICLGGTAFVHESAAEIIDRLRQACPLPVQPVTLTTPLSVQRCGAGSIRTFSRGVFQADDNAAPQILGTEASRLSHLTMFSTLERSGRDWGRSANSDRTRAYVAGFFGFYTILSGLVTLVLFRAGRKVIATWIVTVVCGACILSVVLGGLVRSSRGDCLLTTVTQGSPSGLTQLSRISIQSAGGRSTRAAVQGTRPDLQAADALQEFNRYRSWRHLSEAHRKSYYPAFAWQASLADKQPGSYMIDVPMTPWGSRQLFATSFSSDLKALDIRITTRDQAMSFADDGSVNGNLHAMMQRLDVSITNSLPFALEECQLVVQAASAEMNSNQPGSPFNPQLAWMANQPRPAANSRILLDEFHFTPVDTIEPGQMVSPARTNWTECGATDWQQGLQTSTGFVRFPPSAYPGACGIWIVGRIRQSPALAIDEEQTDFDTAGQLHIFLQEVLPEQLPDEWHQWCQRRLDRQLKWLNEVESK